MDEYVHKITCSQSIRCFKHFQCTQKGMIESTWTSMNTFRCINIVFIVTTISLHRCFHTKLSFETSDLIQILFYSNQNIVEDDKKEKKMASGSSFIAAAEYFHHFWIKDVIEISLFAEIFHMTCSKFFCFSLRKLSYALCLFIW